MRVLFNTHWHLDHTGGNDAVAPSGTTIVAHENTRLWMSTKFYVEWEDRATCRARRRPAEQDLLLARAAAARRSFGGTEVDTAICPRLTPTATSTCVPGAQRDRRGRHRDGGRYPVLDYITGGWIGGLADATKKLIALSDAETLIVPDAGPPQRRADLEAQLAMLETVRERIEAIALQGRGVEDMIAERSPRNSMRATGAIRSYYF